MKKFRYDSLSKFGFSLLMSLLGTDYTDNRLSPSQVSYILSRFEAGTARIFEEEDRFDYTTCGINSAIDSLISILKYDVSDLPRSQIRECRNFSHIKQSAYVDSILWYLKYIRDGLVND
jgi:hypothetical protein